MQAKILAQRDGLGIGWLPRQRVAGLLASGALREMRTEQPREPNTLYVAWRGSHRGKALDWWLTQLRRSRLARALVQGIDFVAP
jgi:DNA-binding transcriptional LysR family regulator